MDHTRHRNAVLIFVAPRTHKFAVIGDAGVHTHCGDIFWRELTEEMTGHFRKSEFTSGIMHGIRRAGQRLAGISLLHPAIKMSCPMMSLTIEPSPSLLPLRCQILFAALAHPLPECAAPQGDSLLLRSRSG